MKQVMQRMANDVSAVSTNGSGDLAGNPFGAKGSYNIRLTKKTCASLGIILL